MDDRQQGFGWSIKEHRQREELLAAVNLPRSLTVEEGTVCRTVSAAVVRALLYRLNHFAWGNTWCYPSIETLCEKTDFSDKQVRRGIKALRQQGLLTVERRKTAQGVSCNHYRIEWERVREMATYRGHPERDQSAMRTDPPAIREGPIGHSEGTNRPSGADQSAMRTDPPATMAAKYMNGMNEEIHESMEGGVSEMSGEKGLCLLPDLRAERLNDPDVAQRLWEAALEHPATRDLYRDDAFDRLRWFAWCFCVWRKRSKLRNPPGFFHHVAGQGREAIVQQIDDEHDLAWARKVIRERDGPASGGPPAEVVQEATRDPVSADPSAEFERRKSDELRRLWEWSRQQPAGVES
jgi:hypothetical protein